MIMHESQQKLGTPQNKLKKPSGTRWFGSSEPTFGLNDRYTSVVDHIATAASNKQNNADTRQACKNVLQALTDVSTFLVMLAVLPYMRMMKVLILQLQSRSLYAGDQGNSMVWQRICRVAGSA
jgi:hypothetical protein